MVYVSVVRSAIPKRIPTIRFRKGGGNGISSASDGFIAATMVAGRGSSGGANVSKPTIEDWQLPRRYWRKELDDKEIDYINRGGPE
uniref:Putative 28s ribosomal protein s36 mitochondrial-like isoform x1 n=1 Tax=Phlebotomus kandelakii TaxID=1109342 RepID=A0A6B2E694_9DIPT